ncbi:transglutaminase domain-containing protein [Psychroserpens sp. BH13MA-6]
MKFKFTIALFLIVFSAKSQDFKFGKVSKEELMEKAHPLDSLADAAVLYRNEHVRFDYIQGDGFTQVKEVHERIKIYNKEGYKWATKRIKIYNETNAKKENLTKLKGYTYNLVNGKIEEDKLRKDGMFSEETNKYWKTESFTMPNIKEGAVIEYTYQIRSPFSAIDDIDYQYTIPINKFELDIKTPEYYMYNKLLNPRASYTPPIEESLDSKTIVFTNTNSNIGSTDLKPSRIKTTQSKESYRVNVLSSSCDNVPALKPEPFVDNVDNYRAKLIMELSAVKFPNQQLRPLSTNWDAVTKTIYSNDGFGGQLSKSGYFENDIDALVGGVEDPIQKAGMIYHFVKSKMQWNEFYGFTSDIGVRRAYKDGAGNVADINLMLTAMLRYAGIQANPVLVSTKNHGIPLFPTQQGFNYVICMVEHEGFNVLLDASSPYSSFNVLPARVLNWQGRVVRESGSSAWINLYPNSLSSEVTSLNVKINPDLTIDGKVRQQKTDYLAMDFRNKFANTSPDEYIKSIEKDNGELLVSDLQIENETAYTEPVKITYNYELENAVEDIGGNLYVSPMLFMASEENPFKQEKRQYPIDLTYPFSTKYMVNVMIPEGYAVESLPKSEKLDFNSNVGGFTYLVKENGSFLQLTIALDMRSPIIIAQDYEIFKKFYTRVIEKQSEKIVLKKL